MFGEMSILVQIQIQVFPICLAIVLSCLPSLLFGSFAALVRRAPTCAMRIACARALLCHAQLAQALLHFCDAFRTIARKVPRLVANVTRGTLLGLRAVARDVSRAPAVVTLHLY
jgi:hypothetical protein